MKQFITIAILALCVTTVARAQQQQQSEVRSPQSEAKENSSSSTTVSPTTADSGLRTADSSASLPVPVTISQRMQQLQQALAAKQTEFDTLKAQLETVQSQATSLQLAMEIARRDALDVLDVKKEDRQLFKWKLDEKAGWVLVKTPPTVVTKDGAK